MLYILFCFVLCCIVSWYHITYYSGDGYVHRLIANSVDVKITMYMM